MLQNPHREQRPHCPETRPHCPEPRPHRHQMGGVALYGDPCATCLPMTSPPNGGNCTIRGATRRQNPPNAAKPPPLPPAPCSRTGAGLPDGAPINAGRASPTMTRGRRAASSQARLVADEALHSIRKIQPQRITCNSSLTGAILPITCNPPDGMAPIGCASTQAQ